MPAPTIEETLISLLRPGLTAPKLLAGVRTAHPEASKKEIVHAAFAAVLVLAESNVDKARQLQDFAIRSRGHNE